MKNLQSIKDEIMIDQLIKEEDELILALRKNRDKQRDYYTSEFLEKHGIKIGDTIKFKNGKQTLCGVIHRIDYSGVRPIYPMVRLFNKDGSVGKREARCWSYSMDTIEIVNNVPL